ncbi:MAG: hypothetical protein HY815_28050 [Candidatus Riflebacteria bacterium]|nr:hypothetical protein [Candidatus Riflebacteria bacterium]
MNEPSAHLHFASHRLQEVALLFMAVVYTIRLIWYFRFPAAQERQAPTGGGWSTPDKGILFSLLIIATPWEMESTRKRWFLWCQFVVFHLGVAASIALSFVIPYLPKLLTSTVVVGGLQLILGLACLVGVMRLVRRVGNMHMRAISSPDDYFSLALLTVWLGIAAATAPNNVTRGEGLQLTYFYVTAFFLMYVPFSKISHYLYYPFTRYYLGKSFGRRGLFPIRRGPEPQA